MVGGGFGPPGFKRPPPRCRRIRAVPRRVRRMASFVREKRRARRPRHPHRRPRQKCRRARHPRDLRGCGRVTRNILCVIKRVACRRSVRLRPGGGCCPGIFPLLVPRRGRELDEMSGPAPPHADDIEILALTLWSSLWSSVLTLWSSDKTTWDYRLDANGTAELK